MLVTLPLGDKVGRGEERRRCRGCYVFESSSRRGCVLLRRSWWIRLAEIRVVQQYCTKNKSVGAAEGDRRAEQFT